MVYFSGEGLLTSSGSKWQRDRKLLTPVFHFKVLQEYVSHMERCFQHVAVSNSGVPS